MNNHTIKTIKVNGIDEIKVLWLDHGKFGLKSSTVLDKFSPQLGFSRWPIDAQNLSTSDMLLTHKGISTELKIGDVILGSTTFFAPSYEALRDALARVTVVGFHRRLLQA